VLRYLLFRHQGAEYPNSGMEPPGRVAGGISATVLVWPNSALGESLVIGRSRCVIGRAASSVSINSNWNWDGFQRVSADGHPAFRPLCALVRFALRDPLD